MREICGEALEELIRKNQVVLTTRQKAYLEYGYPEENRSWFCL